MNSLAPADAGAGSLRAVLFLVAVLAGGCASGPPDSDQAPVTTRPPAPATPPPADTTAPTRDPGVSAACEPLLARAGEARAQGDYESALALLERAQRIDPDSPRIYLDMARTHQARGDASRARATAERGLLYCEGWSGCEALRAIAR